MKSRRQSDLSDLKKSASFPASPLNDWHERSFRRFLVDIHIPDWDPRFLSKLDPRKFVDTLAKGGSSSIMVYCNSHVGPTLYPSKLGPAHKALGKKDFVGEVLKHARAKDLSVVAYYSAVYNNAAFLEHPDWRILPHSGVAAYENNRYGTCCPNSPYRDFAVAQTEELCGRYEFDGIFFDMLFWPFVCYCPHCERRFQEEEGAKLPRVIDWHNPTWMAFQRARERWMKEWPAAHGSRPPHTSRDDGDAPAQPCTARLAHGDAVRPDGCVRLCERRFLRTARPAESRLQDLRGPERAEAL